MAEPTTGVRFAGVLRDGSGNLITSGVTANSYDIGTTTPTRGTEDSTFTSGKFAIADSGFGRFDVKIVNGSEQIWWSSLAEVQVTSLQARNPTTASAALEVFSTTSEASSLVAVFGFRPSTESSGAETADTPSDGDKGYINFELSNDATSKEQWVAGRLEWEGVDVSNGSEDGQLNLWAMTNGTLVEELHLSGAALWPEADAGLDLGTTALGFNDLHLGSGGIINLDGGDVTLTHSSGTLTYGGDGAVSVAFGANVDLQFTGGTGTNEIVLANGLADALSITDGSADVIAISTAGGTNTVAITGDLTVSGTIAADTAAVATTVTITDNEDTNEANAIIFTSGGDVDGGNIGLESDGTLNYNPSTGTLTSTVFAGNLTGNASGTAATVTGGTQASITAAANLITVGTIGTGVWQGTAIASAYIAADAITGAKIADDAIDSEHYTDGSIDTAHLAADAVTGAKIADDAIDSEHYTDGSIDTAHIADDQVTLAKMAGLTRGSMIIGDSSGNPSALVKGSANYVLTSDGTDIAWAAAATGTTSWDAVAAASGGDYSTIQAADDALDASTTGYSLFVKGQQEYAEDVTISTAGAYIVIEGTTTLDGDWTISGDNCHVIVGPGAIIEGAWVISGAGCTVEFGGGFLWTGNGTLSGVGSTLKLGGDSDHVGINTMSANETSILCENGVETDGLVVTGVSCTFDGGGYNTVIDGSTARHAVSATAAHGFMLMNCGVETLWRQGNSYDAMYIYNTAVWKVHNVHVHNSDRYGLNATSDNGTTRGYISDSYMDACDDAFIHINEDHVTVSNVMGVTAYDGASAGTGIIIGATGDNAVVAGCNLRTIALSNSITIDTNAENCVVIGNRLDGAVSDSSGTSTVGADGTSNDNTAY